MSFTRVDVVETCAANILSPIPLRANIFNATIPTPPHCMVYLRLQSSVFYESSLPTDPIQTVESISSRGIEQSCPMGRSLISSTSIPLRFSQIPRSLNPVSHHKLSPPFNFDRFASYRIGFRDLGVPRNLSLTLPMRRFCTKAVISEFPNEKRYSKIGADSPGPIPAKQLLEAVEIAAKTGAEVRSFPITLFFAH